MPLPLFNFNFLGDDMVFYYLPFSCSHLHFCYLFLLTPALCLLWVWILRLLHLFWPVYLSQPNFLTKLSSPSTPLDKVLFLWMSSWLNCPVVNFSVRNVSLSFRRLCSIFFTVCHPSLGPGHVVLRIASNSLVVSMGCLDIWVTSSVYSSF